MYKCAGFKTLKKQPDCLRDLSPNICIDLETFLHNNISCMKRLLDERRRTIKIRGFLKKMVHLSCWGTFRGCLNLNAHLLQDSVCPRKTNVYSSVNYCIDVYNNKRDWLSMYCFSFLARFVILLFLL